MDWKATIRELNEKMDNLSDRKQIEIAKGNKIVAGRISKDIKKLQDASAIIRKYFL